MSRIPPFARGMAIIALVAVVIVVFNLQRSLSTAATLLRIGFLLAIALAAYLLWRDFGRREIRCRGRGRLLEQSPTRLDDLAPRPLRTGSRAGHFKESTRS